MSNLPLPKRMTIYWGYQVDQWSVERTCAHSTKVKPIYEMSLVSYNSSYAGVRLHQQTTNRLAITIFHASFPCSMILWTSIPHFAIPPPISTIISPHDSFVRIDQASAGVYGGLCAYSVDKRRSALFNRLTAPCEYITAAFFLRRSVGVLPGSTCTSKVTPCN